MAEGDITPEITPTIAKSLPVEPHQDGAPIIPSKPTVEEATLQSLTQVNSQPAQTPALTREKQEKKEPTRTMIKEAFQGERGVLALIQHALDGGMYTTNSTILAAQLHIDPTDPQQTEKIEKERIWREHVQTALSSTMHAIDVAQQIETKLLQGTNVGGVITVFDANGEKQEVLRVHGYVEPLLEAVGRLSIETEPHPDGNALPTSRAQEAQRLLATLTPYAVAYKTARGNEIYFASPETVHIDQVINAAQEELEERVRMETVFTYENGRIIGIDHEALTNQLEGKSIDPAVSQLTLLLDTYYGAGHSQDIQENSSSLLYALLHKVKPERVRDISHAERHKACLQILDGFLRRQLQQVHCDPSVIPLEYLVRDLLLAHVAEGNILYDREGLRFSKGAKEAFQALKKDQQLGETEETVILGIGAQKGAATRLLGELLGMGEDLLQNPATLSRIATKVVEKLGNQKNFSPPEREAYLATTLHHLALSHAEELGENRATAQRFLGAAVLLFALFGPQLSALLNTTGEEQAQR